MVDILKAALSPSEAVAGGPDAVRTPAHATTQKKISNIHFTTISTPINIDLIQQDQADLRNFYFYNSPDWPAAPSTNMATTIMVPSPNRILRAQGFQDRQPRTIPTVNAAQISSPMSERPDIHSA